jgi:hypothetical protein
MATIKAPFGAISDITIAVTGTTAVTITNSKTMNLTIPTLTGNATLDLTLSSELKSGAELFLQIKTTGSETFTFGTGIEAPVVTGSAGKTWSQGFVYNGTIFTPMGAKIQID